MLNEPTFVPRTIRCVPKFVLQRRKRACPTGKVYDGGPDHDWHMDQCPSLINQYPKATENCKRDKDKVENQDKARSKSIRHRPSPMRHRARRCPAAKRFKRRPTYW